jgi:hypothetical protein
MFFSFLPRLFNYTNINIQFVSASFHKPKHETNKNKLRGSSPQARTIPTERPPLVGEVSANFSG